MYSLNFKAPPLPDFVAFGIFPNREMGLPATEHEATVSPSD